MSSKEIRTAARADLKGHWAEAAMMTFVYILIIMIVNLSVSPLLDQVYAGLSILVTLAYLPLAWGYTIVFLMLQRKDENALSFDALFSGYKDFSRIFTTIFLAQLYTFLWSLLLIIPGIIKQYSYSMTSTFYWIIRI